MAVVGMEQAAVEDEAEEEETGAEGAAVEGPAGGSSRVRVYVFV